MTEAATERPIRWERHDDGVVVLTLDAPGRSANTMDHVFSACLLDTLDRLEDVKDDITGVVITSAKKTFVAGGDINEMLQSRPEDGPVIADGLGRIKNAFRRLETLGVPVVAAINGAALGGGLELALACHHRIAADVEGCVIGLPEVNLGLLPAGGGVVRSVRLLGVVAALQQVLLRGQRHTPQAALELGLIDKVVATRDDLLDAAKSWIATGPEPVQPWDTKGYRLPGGTLADPGLASMIAPITGALRKDLRGANLPAPSAILAAAVEGSHLDIQAAGTIETRYFVELVTGPVAKNMMNTFLDTRKLRSGLGRPKDVAPFTATRIGVIGAGMMGAGIAYQAARHGIDVVLSDVSSEAAEKGKGYSATLVEKAVARGRMDQAEADALLRRITTTDQLSELAGCDAVIEAVFEDTDLKKRILREVASHLGDGALIASNTSSLPISDLATALDRPQDLVGMHFFSPVDKMPLLEIVVGVQTSDAALARAFDVGTQLAKTNIVVNDSRGFFTSRTIGKYIDEALAMLGEGCPAASIEQAALQAGYPTGTLQLVDETSISLPHRVRAEQRAGVEAAGQTWESHPGEAVMARMVEEFARHGRAAGAGFYDYKDGRRVGLWPGLRDHFGADAVVPFEDMKERLLFSEALETVHCYDEGVLRSVAEANIGSMLGIGYPGWTGGTAQFVNGYPGGLPAFVARARQLAERYGQRFAPPQSVVELAERGGLLGQGAP